MKMIIQACAFFLIPFASMVEASSGEIRFRGMITEPTCQVDAKSQSCIQVANTKIEVKKGISVEEVVLHSGATNLIVTHL